MNHRAIRVFAAFLLAAPLAVRGDGLPRPNWTHPEAAVRAAAVDAQVELAPLYALAREGRGDELLQRVHAIEADPGLAEPAREKILFELAVALGDFEPGRVGPETLEYLAGRSARVRVPHAEHPAMGVPLYNIRAAASGSLAQWARRRASGKDGARASTQALAEGPESLLRALSASPGPEQARLLRDARGRLGPEEIDAVVATVPVLPTTAAALVLAELAPDNLDSTVTAAALFGLLDHPEYGAAAALALARHGDRAILEQLNELAGQAGSLAARRAAMALDAVARGEP